MKNIQDFHEKKRKWRTWDDKEKDLAPYLDDIMEKLQCEITDLSLVRQEKDLLQTIINELTADHDVVREEMETLKKAYFSVLEEIYKMPGCVEDLNELLKSHPSSLDTYEIYMITQDWNDQYDRGTRKLKKNSSSTPLTEEEIEQWDEFLKIKCTELAEAKAKIGQLAPRLLMVFDLLQLANNSLYSALNLLDNKNGSSSPRKKFSSGEGNDSSGEDPSFSSREYSSSSSSSGEDLSSSSTSGEDSSSSSRKNKRTRKCVEDNVTSPTQKL